MTETPQPPTANVIAPPPILLLAAVLLALEADNLWPAPALPATVQYAAGGLLVGAALGLAAWAMARFRRASTPVPTWKPAATLVTAGPYRLSRNPIYLAMVVFVLGLGALVDSLWFLPAALLLALALDRAVIAREERYLRAVFGTEYDDYCRRVRRWI